MKNTIYILLSMMMGLTGCSSQKKLQRSAPFTVGTAVCQEWVGGREESGKGQTVKVVINEMAGKDIVLQNIYFRGEMAKIAMEMEDEGMMAIAVFRNDRPDIIMHADPKKEVGNQPPKLKSKEEKEFPFELKRDEAIISYMENEKVKYFKINNIKEKPARIYPTRPQN